MNIKLTTTKRATKGGTYEMLKRLRAGEELTTEEIDSMLIRFAPAAKTTVKPDDKMAWLSKAVAKQDIREYLKFIFVEKGFGYATNGHVIHKAAVDLPDGWYCAKTHLPIEMEAKAPRCDQLFEMVKHKHVFHEDVTIAKMDAVLAADKTMLLEYGAPHPEVSEILTSVASVNASYLKAATNNDHDEKFKVSDNGNGSMLFSGSNDFGTWLIASTRV